MWDDAEQIRVFWTSGSWRCQERRALDGRRWLELFHREDVALTRPCRNAEEVEDIAKTWFAAFTEQDAQLLPPEPTRRRHGTNHSGDARRHGDPC